MLPLLLLPTLASAFATAAGTQSSDERSVQATPGDQSDALGRNRAIIRQAQRSLTRKQFNPGPADGIVGPRTEAALKRFQQAQRLEVTGRLDRDTLTRLGVREGTPEHVREVQKALAATGLDPGPVDGLFGPRTKAALRRYASAQAPRGRGPAYDTIERFMQTSGQQQSP